VIVLYRENFPSKQERTYEEEDIWHIVGENGKLHIKLIVYFFIKRIIVESTKVGEPKNLPVNK
jgi:hypothetical protein